MKIAWCTLKKNNLCPINAGSVGGGGG